MSVIVLNQSTREMYLLWFWVEHTQNNALSSFGNLILWREMLLACSLIEGKSSLRASTFHYSPSVNIWDFTLFKLFKLYPFPWAQLHTWSKTHQDLDMTWSVRFNPTFWVDHRWDVHLLCHRIKQWRWLPLIQWYSICLLSRIGQTQFTSKKSDNYNTNTLVCIPKSCYRSR